MWRYRLAVSLVAVIVTGAAVPAAAEPAPGRAELLAARLAKDPVQVTDHTPRDLPADAADRLRTAMRRVGAPFYVVVEPPFLRWATRQSPEDLISLLHDRLGEDGIYLVTDPSGLGTVRQFGGGLPVRDAWSAAGRELTFDTGVLERADRFAEILTAPDVTARLAHLRERPEAAYEKRSRERDRAEWTAFTGGTALGALAVAVLIAAGAVRKRARR
ncbi:hypothetical protein [Actinocorallia longicatena]|uniref:hypothetical protein n=1 Tax=Actinocorallia longicatena TaxID=111803 RepID=UPI0031CEB399